ncbi:MAG: hypothetical protein KIS67_26160 [Verrucomicrobiae bacterium]|nr:hypothetical protein [Verrucomicrobiae bacterium]
MIKLPLLLLAGLILASYPLWAGKRDTRTKVKRVYVAIGIAVLCWWGSYVWLGSVVEDPESNVVRWQRALQVKQIFSGIVIGLVMGLIIQGELFPFMKKSPRSAGSPQPDKPPGAMTP